MSRERRTVEQIINDIQESGYKLTAFGAAGTDEWELADELRATGYVVRWFYLKDDGGSKYYEIYVKERVQRRSSKKSEEAQIIDFDSMTVKELKKLCSEKKIRGYAKMNKQQIIESLKKAC